MNERKNAVLIGTVTVLSYLANYFLRNMLGVLTPYIVKATDLTTDYLAMLSSFYMIAYAAGQLFNGVMGDFVKPKKMVITGLIAAAAATALFPTVAFSWLGILCFVVLGYALSMLRGPLMKIISENMKPDHARITCVLFSFASFAGPLVAGFIAMLFDWMWAFAAAGILTVAVALFAYISLTALEKKSIISFKKTESFNIKSMLGVFKIKGFIFYLIIACLVEIAATSISFWIPTFLTEYVHFNESASSMVFSAISLVRALVPFAALAIYKLSGERDVLIMKTSYALSVALFALTFFVPSGILTVIFLLLALVMNSLVSALLWSIYIPGLGKTGKVSGANGVLDCTGYVAASAANLLFSEAVTYFGYRGLIAAWGVIPTIGLVAAIIFGIRKDDKQV